jgi:hypothetical protein
MSRGAVACRGRFGAEEREDSSTRLEAQNAILREQVAEVEGWYRLLQAEHTNLQTLHGRCGREAIGLRATVHRLEVENKELQDILARAGRGDSRTQELTRMRIQGLFRSVVKYKWVAATALALGALAARDPWVGGLFGSAATRVRDAVGRRDGQEQATADSGYVRYAAMVQAREQAERARDDYNAREASLKGDALLEAQDRLRAAKARYLRARLAFLPELARRCDEVGVPLPREAAEALVALKTEARD